MDNFVTDLKKKASELLLEAMIVGLDTGEITVEDSQRSARKIELHLDQIESQEELLVFLRSLDKTYPCYRSVFIKLKEEEALHEDKIKLQSVQERLKQLTNNHAS